MSAQLSQHTITRVLVAEKSESSAHQLDSALRNAGIGTKLTISDDLVHIAQLLSAGQADIAIIGAPITGLQQLLPRMRDAAPQIPIIVLTDDSNADGTLSSAELMQLGATDTALQGDDDLLALIVQRELQHIGQQEHYKEMQLSLHEAEQRCQQLLQGSKAAIAYVHEGMHIHANEGYLSLFGYETVDDLECVSLVDVLSEHSGSELKEHLKALRNDIDESLLEFTGKHADDSPVSGSMTLANSQYEGESCIQITIRPDTPNNKSAQAEANDSQVQNGSSNGSSPPVVITEGGTIGEFISDAQTLFDKKENRHYVLALAIDHLDKLQSTHGVLAATRLCDTVWEQVSSLVDDAPLMRLSIHEFLIAICTEEHALVVGKAEKWTKSIGDIILEANGKSERPTVCIAGTQLISDLDVVGAIDIAHQNLKELQTQEKFNTVHLPTLSAFAVPEGVRDAALVLHQITDAIEQKSFILLYQPVISLRGDADEHYEVFLRMRDTGGGLIQPGEFLQTAIDNEVAGKIDRWVILQAIKTLTAHRAEGHSTRLTINITCNSVTDPEFPQWLAVAIKAARLPSDAIIFQITEADAVTYTRQTRDFLERLTKIHCRAALSRFGLNKDPFSALQHFPVDIVKVDGSFVEGADQDQAMAKGLTEMVGKLQNLGKLTLVPMVENPAILSTLWQAGANYIQGHYLQEPSPHMDYDFSTDE